jgi:hypothetical protein
MKRSVFLRPLVLCYAAWSARLCKTLQLFECFPKRTFLDIKYPPHSALLQVKSLQSPVPLGALRVNLFEVQAETQAANESQTMPAISRLRDVSHRWWLSLSNNTYYKDRTFPPQPLYFSHIPQMCKVSTSFDPNLVILCHVIIPNQASHEAHGLIWGRTYST